MDIREDHPDSIVVRFAGDSGDGMQLTGDQFTRIAAMAGNDIVTFPDYPAEIRAPAGSLAGVSVFQVHLASREVFTPGDAADVLVAMNPAALKSNLGELRSGGTVVLNTGTINRKNLQHAGYAKDPRETGELDAYQVYEVDVSHLAQGAVDGLELTFREALRCKNFFALGLVSWMFHREVGPTMAWIEGKFGTTAPTLAEANRRALKAGYHYGETQEIVARRYEVPKADLAPGLYRDLAGNEGIAIGLTVAAERAGLELLLASYPITPASDILHHLAGYKRFGVRTFQAEDEIAAMCAAIGAAYAGALGVTTTSGPGFSLKSEAMGLAVSLELPLVIVNCQRAGPSTGLPTKVEQADLLQACFGRSGEAPLPVLAARSPSDCFSTVLEAVRIALRFMTPVVVLSDAALANGSEPWRVPELADIPRIPVSFAADPATFKPYSRNDDLARPWALPGTPGLEHRIGGLEKEDVEGGISYDPANHERMVKLRAEKVQRVAETLDETEVYGDTSGDLVLVGWGSSYGAIREAVDRLRRDGHRVGHVHLRQVNPLPRDLPQVLAPFARVLVPELNMGQLATLLRAEFLVDARSYCKVQGRPFKVSEIVEAVTAQLEAH